MFNFKSKEKGQGLVEYALILVLVAVVVIAGLQVLGPQIGNVFSDINSAMAGGGSGLMDSTNQQTAINDYCTANPGAVYEVFEFSKFQSTDQYYLIRAENTTVETIEQEYATEITQQQLAVQHAAQDICN